MMLSALGFLAALSHADTRNLIADTRRYSAGLVRVVDGDTLRVDLDLKLDVTLRNQPVRLLGIDAPEMRGPERERGLAARRALEAFLAGKPLEVEIHGKDRYGRWLADVWAEGENVALWMLREKLARPYQIGRRAATLPASASPAEQEPHWPTPAPTL